MFIACEVYLKDERYGPLLYHFSPSYLSFWIVTTITLASPRINGSDCLPTQSQLYLPCHAPRFRIRYPVPRGELIYLLLIQLLKCNPSDDIRYKILPVFHRITIIIIRVGNYTSPKQVALPHFRSWGCIDQLGAADARCELVVWRLVTIGDHDEKGPAKEGREIEGR
jgi:hypothetical protein